MGYRFILLFSLVCLLTACALSIHSLVTGLGTAKPQLLILLFAGLLGTFVGTALRDLTERIEKLEAARDDEK